MNCESDEANTLGRVGVLADGSARASLDAKAVEFCDFADGSSTGSKIKNLGCQSRACLLEQVTQAIDIMTTRGEERRADFFLTSSYVVKAICCSDPISHEDAPAEWQVLSLSLPRLRAARAYDLYCLALRRMAELHRVHGLGTEAELQAVCLGPEKTRQDILRGLLQNAAPGSIAAAWQALRQVGALPRAALPEATVRLFKRLKQAGEEELARDLVTDRGTVEDLCRSDPDAAATPAEWQVLSLSLPRLRAARAYDLYCLALRRMAELHRVHGLGTEAELQAVCLGPEKTRQGLLVAIMREASPRLAALAWREFQATMAVPRAALLTGAIALYKRSRASDDPAYADAFAVSPALVGEICKIRDSTAETAPLEWRLCLIAAPRLRAVRAYDHFCLVLQQVVQLRFAYDIGLPAEHERTVLGREERRLDFVQALMRRASPRSAMLAWQALRALGVMTRPDLLLGAFQLFTRLKRSADSALADAFVTDARTIEEICKDGSRSTETRAAEEQLCRVALARVGTAATHALELDLLRKLGSISGESSHLHVRAAFAHLRLGEYDRALTSAAAARALSPSDFGPLRVVFRVYGVRKQSTAAREHLTALLHSQAVELTEAAQLAEEASQTDLALQLYSRAWASKRGSSDRFLKFARALFSAGDISALATLFRSDLSQIGANRRVQAACERWKTLDRALSGSDGSGGEAAAARELNEAILLRLTSRPRRVSGAARDGARAPSRCAIVIDSLGPGGAQRQCRILTEALMKSRGEGRIDLVQVFVRNSRRERDRFFLPGIEASGAKVVPYYAPDFDPDLTSLPVDPDAIELVSLIEPQGRARSLMHLIAKLDAFKPDVIYGWLDELVLQAGVMQAFFPEARVLGRWGSMPPGQFRQETPRRLLEAERQRLCYRVLRQNLPQIGFFANSRATAKAYQDWLGWEDDAVGVIYNGFDFAANQPSPGARRTVRAALNIPDEAFVFGGVGRMSEEKRPFLWCDLAARILAATDASCHFILVGDGPLLEPVRAHAARLHALNIHIVGRQENLPDWYAAMDAFLMTSSVEGMSNALAEAQSAALPVICFDVGGLSEAVEHGDTGYLIPDMALDELLARCLGLVSDRSLARSMGAAAKRDVHDRFSVDSLLRRTMLAFENSN